MAKGYASNIPLEEPPPEGELLPAEVCIICKKRRRSAPDAEMCATCASALGA